MRQQGQGPQSLRKFTLVATAVLLLAAFGSEAEAGGLKKFLQNHVSTKDLEQDHEDLDGKLNMLKESTEVLEANQTMMKEDIATILEKLMNGGGGGSDGGFPCTSGGTPVGDRWVVSDSGLTVCDKDFGNTWEQRPLLTQRTWQDAIDYCPTLGAGWALPEEEVLLSLLDFTSSTCTGTAGSLCLSDGHPFDNVQSDLTDTYWSATTTNFMPTNAAAVGFNVGLRSSDIKTHNNFVWCARSGS